MVKQEAVVIGAGMVGVSVAWHLQKKGFQVTLVDKKLPGEETSFGNAGLIQREAIYPHPFPTDVRELWRIAFNNSLDIRYRPRAIMHYRQPLLRYWQASLSKNYRAIVPEWAQLIEHSTASHQEMMDGSDTSDLIHQKGWLQLHRTQASFDHAIEQAKSSSQYGVEYAVLTTAEIAVLEPHLKVEQFVGGIHWLNSWQVSNPSQLVKQYAKSFEQMGGHFKRLEVRDLLFEDNHWVINTAQETLKSPCLVIAAGPWSTNLVQGLGYQFPLFPMRGYHQHYALKENAFLNHSIVDEDNGFVLGPMEAGIRLTTGAEFTFMDAEIRNEQLVETEAIAFELLPLTQVIEKEPWFGHRPCLPDMKPIIGSAHKHSGLWFAFGHAHQGFTLGPVTGKLLAQMITGEEELLVCPQPFAANRFGS